MKVRLQPLPGIRGRGLAWIQSLSPAFLQTGFLFLIDIFTNLTDYSYHVYLGRRLGPADFAVAQTVNSAILIVVTAFAVLQPVVARFVAEAMVLPAGMTTASDSPTPQMVFQAYFRSAVVVGGILTGIVWLMREWLAAWINVPVAAVGLSATMFLLALLRPVVTGMLQGQQRFVAFGLTRMAFAISRLLLGVLLVALGAGALGAIATWPVGFTLALAVGLGFLGFSVWRNRPDRQATGAILRAGVRLSLHAFFAYAAYMTLLNNDLIWVNRSFPATVASSYATVVLLRRVLLVLPAAAVVVMYPRVVTRVAQGRRPDRILGLTAGVVLGLTIVMSGVYFVAGPTVLRLTFGPAYLAAAPLLGWMGMAMMGYGLAAIWLNLYLATKPLPFVIWLGAVVLLQTVLLMRWHASLAHITAIFLGTGWLLALGGAGLYGIWLRPRLAVGA